MTINKQAEDVNGRSPDRFGCDPADAFVKTRELKPGEVIERYKIIRLVGRGAIGSVYEVEQIYMHRRFALKTLNPIAHSDVALRRFQQEAKAAGRLEHPNLVRAVDFGMIDETQPFLIMDFLEGQTLSEYLKLHARISVEEALNIFIPVAFALGYAHSEGVIHRDIKPSNIVLTVQDNKMVPKVVDFGIAKVDQTEALTRTGEVFGTPLYMSPEQCSGIKVDHRTDIYALGCVLFEALTGTPPLRGTSALETMMQHSTVAPPSLKEASLGLDFPSDLQTVISKMMAKDPDQRYQDILFAADDLAAIQHGRQINVVPPKPSANQVAAPVHRNNSMVGSLLLVLAGAIACGAVIVICQLITGQDMKHRQAETAALLKQRQARSTADVLATTLPDESAADDSSLYFPEHYSQIENGNRVFRFPNVRTLGNMVWFDVKTGKNHIRDNLRNQNVVVPLNCPFICFDPAPDSVYLGAKVAAPFQNGDLQGLSWSPGQDTTAPNLARNALNAYTKIQSLRFIELRDVVSPAALENIGKLPDLRWLVIDRPGELIESEGENGELGALLAEMPSLRHLRVFGLNSVKNPGPVIEQLATNSSLVRLQLRDEDLSRRDFTAISQMKNLAMLDLSTVDKGQPTLAECHWLWAKLAQIPKLQHLCIDQKYLGIGRDGKPAPELLQDLKRLRQLRQFAINPSHLQDKTASAEQKKPTQETRKRIKECLPPGCEFAVRQELYSTFIIYWFMVDNAEDVALLR
jgi:serine/threonine protein kinase